MSFKLLLAVYALTGLSYALAVLLPLYHSLSFI